MKQTVLHPDKIETVWVGYICGKQMRLQKIIQPVLTEGICSPAVR